MVDIIIIIVLLAIVGAAVNYIVKVKKSGARCIGCPDSGNCGHRQSVAGGSGNCGGNCTGCSGTCGESCSEAGEKIN